MDKIHTTQYPVGDGRTWTARLYHRGGETYRIDYFLPTPTGRRRKRLDFQQPHHRAAIDRFTVWVADVLPCRCRDAMRDATAGEFGADPALRPLCDWYVDTVMVSRGNKPVTRDRNRRDLHHACDWFAARGVTLVSQLTAQVVTAYQVDLLKALSSSTANLRIHVLRAVLRAAVDADIIQRLPFRQWPSARVSTKPPRAVTPAEIHRIIDALHAMPAYGGGQYARVFEFVAHVGCRPSDAARLRWSDISSDYTEVQFTQQKTGRPVSVALVDGAARLLREERMRHTGSEYVFTDHKGRPWAAGSVVNAFRRHARVILGRPVSIKQLRAAVVTMLLDAGANPRDVQAVTGHRSDAIYAYYARSATRNRALASEVARRIAEGK